MYHFDPYTKEPTRCRFAYGACTVAPARLHYANITEAVNSRLADLRAASVAEAAVHMLVREEVTSNVIDE